MAFSRVLALVPPAPPLVDNPEWEAVCLECGVCRTSKAYCVLGSGNPGSPLVILGEALGEEEERAGLPFQGRAGQVLDRALVEAGIVRKEIWITNALKCRPTNAAGENRPPTVEELTYCRQFLDREMAALPNKRVIIALGASALWALLAPHVPPGGVMENQGRTFFSERYQCTVVATVHPGLILRKPGEAQWLPLDFRKAVEIIRTGRAPVLKQPRFRTVRTIADALEMEAALLRAPYIVWDWETGPNRRTYGNALHPTQAIGTCVSFCGEADFAWVVPRMGADFMPLWTPSERRQLDAILCRIFLSRVPKIGHHVAFDFNQTLTTLGVRPVNVIGCTMVGNHLLLNHLTERAHGLKRMADIETPYGRYDDEIDAWLVTNGYTKDGKPDGGQIYRVPNAITWKYSAIDSIVPWLIHPMLEARLKAANLWTLYQEERVPLALAYAEFDRHGVPVSREKLDHLSADLTTAMAAVKAEIGRIVTTWKCPVHERVFDLKCCEQAKGGKKEEGYPGEPLNPNSGPQVAAYLYDHSGLPVTARTETGQQSTKEEVLLQYVDASPLVQPILNFRSYSKLKGTYIDGKDGTGGILAALDPDGYARPSTLLTAVETLRLATRKPFPVHLIPRPLLVYNCPVHGKYWLPGKNKLPCCSLGEESTLNVRGMVRPHSDRDVLLSGDFDQQEYCVGFGTRVLCADLRWRPAEEVNVGDEIIGFDERLNGRGEESGQRLKTRPSCVQGRRIIERPCYEVVTDAGKIVVSAEHRFVATAQSFAKGQVWKPQRWVEAKDLQPGDRLDFYASPWNDDTSFEGGYLAGLFDGEGFVSAQSNQVGFGQKYGAVLDYAQTLLSQRGYATRCLGATTPGCANVFVTGLPDQLRLLGSVRPLRLLAKARGLWDGVTLPRTRQRPRVLSITPIGLQRVVALGTSTRTLITEGFLSHNCLAAIASHQQDLEEACLDRGEDAHAYVMKLLSGRSKADYQDATGAWLSPAAEAAYLDDRSNHKSLNFMILYLGGASHLARSLVISEAEAQQQINDYYQRLPKIKAWQDGIIATLRATGKVVGFFNVARALPGIFSRFARDRREAERAACNFPFQNGGAHVLFRAVLTIKERWRKARFPGRILFTVHDEIIAQVRRTHAREGMAMMQEEMERPHPELVGGCGIPRGIRASVKTLNEWGGPAIRLADL